MGAFDDLIPAEGKTTSVSGSFDDLVPQKERSAIRDFGSGLYSSGRSTLQGLGQLVQWAAGVPKGKETLVTDEDIARARAEDAPVLNTTAGKLGSFAGDLALSAIPAGGVMRGATMLGRAGLSAAAGAAQGAARPVLGDESRGLNTALGAAIGAVAQPVTELAGSFVRPAAQRVSADVQRAIEFSKQFGGNLTRGQMSGSEWTKRIEKIASSLPGSGGFFRKAGEANEQAVTKAVNSITEGDAGQIIERAGNGRSLSIDAPFVDEMRNVRNSFGAVADRDAPNSALKTIEQYVGSPGVPNPALQGLGPAARASAIKQGVPETIQSVTPRFQVGDTMPLTGERNDFNNYQALRSLYGKRATGGGDPTDKAAYEQVRDAFDSAAERSLAQQGADPAILKQMRDAYSVEKIVQNARKVDADGNVTYDPQKVAKLVADIEKKQPGRLDRMGEAGKMLRDMAAFGRASTPAKSSGTAEGNIAGKILTLDAVKDVATGNAGGLAKSLLGMTMLPWVTNTVMQGTRNTGIPLLRSLPQGSGAFLPQAGVALTLGELAGAQ